MYISQMLFLSCIGGPGFRIGPLQQHASMVFHRWFTEQIFCFDAPKGRSPCQILQKNLRIQFLNFAEMLKANQEKGPGVGGGAGGGGGGRRREGGREGG